MHWLCEQYYASATFQSLAERTRKVTGHWTRANPEVCLLATRGSPKRLSRSVRELVVTPRRERSRKPDEIYASIEALVAGPYLELFARFLRDRWYSVGHQEGVQPRRWRSDSYPEPSPAGGVQSGDACKSQAARGPA
jgi:N6-adenosine-specific RNA methylase IME4